MPFIVRRLTNAGLDKTIGQYFAALTNMRSVGVMGDERTYDYAVALRAVNTIDFMTAEAAEIPYEVLNKVMSRIINEVRGVNRVFYDLISGMVFDPDASFCLWSESILPCPLRRNSY